MKLDADIEQVKADVRSRIEWAQYSRMNDKRKSVFVAVYIGAVSAITTICIGVVSYLPESYSNFFGILSLLTSASLTVVAAWDGIFHHKKLWLNSAVTLNDLYELDTDIRHAESSTTAISQEHANEFYERYKKIMRDTNERWYKIRE